MDAILFMFNPLLGGIALFGAVVIMILALVGEIAMRGALRESGVASRRSNDLIDVFHRNAEAIQVMGMNASLERRWSAHHQTGVAWQAVASDRIAVVQATAKAFRLGLPIAVLAAGAWLAVAHLMSAGVMVAASIIMGRALAPVEAAIRRWQGFVNARAARQRLRMLLDGDAADLEERTALPPPSGRLVAHDVGFRRPGQDAPVLVQISFDLEPGEMLGLIGPSGAGKSSLARLVVGACAPTVGSIRLDGADIAEWPEDELGPYLGYLPQDVELLSGTVAQNIARFGPLDSAKIVDAAKLAGAHELILGMPHDYETQVGASGRSLSGGQRQRVGLARAVYGAARLIVLDEPNANLDAEGEEALRRALVLLKAQKRTVVVITHKPSLLRDVDKLLVLRDGRVDVYGPCDGVMSALHRAIQSRPKSAPSERAGDEARSKAVEETHATA